MNEYEARMKKQWLQRERNKMAAARRENDRQAKIDALYTELAQARAEIQALKGKLITAEQREILATQRNEQTSRAYNDLADRLGEVQEELDRMRLREALRER